MPDIWFAQLTEDPTDPHTPLFWETMNFMSRMGHDMQAPDVELEPASLGVQVMELQRQVALKTPTMAMPVIE